MYVALVNGHHCGHCRPTVQSACRVLIFLCSVVFVFIYDYKCCMLYNYEVVLYHGWSIQLCGEVNTGLLMNKT